MRRLAASLLELQELEILLEESRILHREKPSAQLADVERRVSVLRGRVPGDILQRYDRLRRSGPGIECEVDGVCRGCHLNVPLGDLNRMRRDLIPWICPHCGRFLFLAPEPSEPA